MDCQESEIFPSWGGVIKETIVNYKQTRMIKGREDVKHSTKKCFQHYRINKVCVKRIKFTGVYVYI